MTKNPDAGTPEDRQGGLPDDLGNGMSDRSGYYDESETGMRDTPITPSGQERQPPEAVPTNPEDTNDSGTTFDADTGTGRDL